MNDPAPPASAPRPPSALFLGWLLVALVDAVVIAASLPPRLPIAARALVHFYDAFHLVALALVTTGLVAAYRRFGPKPSSRLAAYASIAALSAVACGLIYSSFAEDLSGAVSRLIFPLAITLPISVFATSLAIPLAAAIGTLLARPWLRLAGVASGLALAATNAIGFVQNYPALHLLAGCTAAILIGASLEGSPFLSRLPLTSSPSSHRGAHARTAALAAASLLAALSLISRPSNEVTIHLSRLPSASLAPFIAELRALEGGRDSVPPAQRAWFADRSSLPPIPPSSPSLLPADPIVILFGIDSMRADLLAKEEYRKELPTLFHLRDESIHFTQARSAGSSTAPSLAAIFSSLYYSQLFWSHRPDDQGLVFPHTDPSKRFPELLSAAGIRTVTYDGVGWLLNDFGIVRGFDEEETFRVKGKPFVPGKPLVGAAIDRLRKHAGGPLFLFVHLLDAHNPYTSAGKKGSKFEGYVAELGLVDKQLKRLRDALMANGQWERTCLIVMADHGEAFGEHGTTWHATTLYDELLHVPLLIRAPGVKARAVDDRVSLVDLGPTILDLMGVATPGRFMGQSLAGYLRGERPELTRPIVAEARLKHAMVLPDGFKVIHDTRNQAVELFDLGHDAVEENNLWDDQGPATERLRVLRTFFDVHTLKRAGYKVPYRKW